MTLTAQIHTIPAVFFTEHSSCVTFVVFFFGGSCFVFFVCFLYNVIFKYFYYF